jgi:hypothetical protein
MISFYHIRIISAPIFVDMLYNGGEEDTKNGKQA